MRVTPLVALLTLMGVAGPGSAQTGEKPEVLILGTYHMANPGNDVHNMDAGDILSERRQMEVEELVEVLKRFRPTKVAVERHVRDESLADRYAAFRAGEFELGRSETYQIGFRLADALDLPTVYPVDEDGNFPFIRVRNYAIANDMREQFDSLGAATAARVAEADAYLAEHTVLETIRRMNSDSAVTRDVGAYYGFVPFAEPWEYAGPDLLAEWFQRNIRIHRNIRAIIDSPDDRVLVVFGAGHLGWLRDNVERDPAVELRTLEDLMP